MSDCKLPLVIGFGFFLFSLLMIGSLLYLVFSGQFKETKKKIRNRVIKYD